MELIETILVIVIVLAAICLTVAVLAQPSKQSGLSGAISGASSETFYGKGKAKSKEKLWGRVTIVLACFFAVVVLAFYILQPFKAKADPGNPDDYYGIPEQTTTEADDTSSTPETSEDTPDSSTPETPDSSTPDSGSSEDTPDDTNAG